MVFHEISNITASLAGVVKSSRINDFYAYDSGTQSRSSHLEVPLKIGVPKKLRKSWNTFEGSHF